MVTDTLLVFESFGLWQVALAGTAVGAALLLSWRGLRRMASPGRRALLLGLRAASLAVLFFLLLRPAWQERQLTPLKSRLAVVVDASESMGLSDGAQTRAGRVKGFLKDQGAALEELQRRYDLDCFQFAGQLRPAALAELGGSSDGDRTDLTASLSALLAASPSAENDWAAVLLLSDGADTEKLASWVEGRPLPAGLGEVLSSLKAPVNTLAVGAGQGLVDLAIAEVRFDDFAFIRNAVEIEVSLSLTGPEEIAVPVTLREGNRNLASSTVSLRPGETRTTKLHFVPDRVGKSVFQVTVPVLPGETITENNTRSFVTSIIRDKIRVLHVVGRPSWDERFLRQVLKRNPNVDLVSFFILRTRTDAPGVSEDELSLIPFPVDELFGPELPTFDVVIFQNFNFGPYQVGFFLPQIARYVVDGGAFAMIGGELSFGAGGYAQTPLEEVLPVRLRADDDRRVQEFVAVPTEEGRHHPVLDLGEADLWEKLPALSSFNLAGAPAEGATVLLAHPFERIGAERAPLLALREVGRGRTAALLTDSSWHWNFLLAGQGGSPLPYHSFWNNLLHWLIQDPALQTISLQASRARYAPGETVRLKIHAHGSPPGARARVSWRGTGQQLGEKAVALDEQGVAELDLPAPGPGAYLALAEVTADSHPLGAAEDAFVVEGVSLERSRPAPRPDILTAIAKATGGVAQRLEQGSLKEIQVHDREHFRVEASTTRPVLRLWWVLAGLISLLAAEWWVRRRWGFA